MHRFFISGDAIQGNLVQIAGQQAQQIANVLRLQPGERVVVLDDSGWEFTVLLRKVGRGEVEGEIERKALAATEPRVKITIYQSLLKGARFEFLLQKATEIGVVSFVPVVSQRCIVSNVDEASNRFTRWQRIVQEAAEQSHRGKMPVIQPPLLFNVACRHARGLSIMPWEEEQGPGLRSLLQSIKARPFSVNLFVGPEGGYTAEEAATARIHGIHTVTLGQRILRAETAAIVAATTVLYEYGDLG